MAHDYTSLTVSQRAATKLEEDTKRRLLGSRRLTLVVDLDQTVIHTTCDPTVGEWKQDKDNPNYEALKDVQQFQLREDGPEGPFWRTYYTKLRPGLEEFLRKIAEMYELHIYTMGTRAYAKKIAAFIDPDQSIFGDRILSRDESGSENAKYLERLFPTDTNMVVIIDDRGDVWNWIPNLIKVWRYDFYVGTGDINASFLPEQKELGTTPESAAKETKEEEPKQPEEQPVNGAAKKSTPDKEVTVLEQMATMGAGDDPKLLQEQVNAREETIKHQVEDRPLLQKQKELDAEDDASADSSESSSSTEEAQEIKPRHRLFNNNDRELYELQDRLQQLHGMFYDEYDKRRSKALGGRVATLRGEKGPSKDKDVDLKLVPDVRDIMPLLKRHVLGGVVVVFSGVLPQTHDAQTSDLGLWAKSFGVHLANRINIRTTHLVAGRNRTAKVREATRYPNIKIVTTQWLLDSLDRWQHQDEEPYLLPVHPDDRGEPVTAEEIAAGERASDDEEDMENVFELAGFKDMTHLGISDEDRDAVEAELREFLGDDYESDTESDAGDPWGEEEGGADSKKRKREDDSDDAEGESGEDDGDGSGKGSRLSQRIKRSYERSTGLREVATAGGSDENLPDQSQDGADEMQEDTANPGDSPENENANPENPDDDELEREMLAAFEEGEYDPDTEAEVTAENSG